LLEGKKTADNGLLPPTKSLQMPDAKPQKPPAKQ
jgi:hypothetical protein